MGDNVLLLNDDGSVAGSAPKSAVHDTETPLHLGFSCYVFDSNYTRTLLTQRAWGKRTWPGVWTNSCCGHPPSWNEISEYVVTRVRYELGIAISTPNLVLPTFRYRAVMASGIVENEICPVYTATTTDTPKLNPEEVANFRWHSWTDFCTQATTGKIEVSDWCLLQMAQLKDLPIDALSKPAAKVCETIVRPGASIQTGITT